MSFNCIKDDKFDFHLEAFSSDKILFQDLSTWADSDQFEIPKEFLIKVLPPATREYIEIPVKVGIMNNISPYLPKRDGIYCIEFFSCGVTYRKSVGLFPELECCILKNFCDENNRDQAEKAKKHLELTKCSIMFNDADTAKESYQLTKTIADKLNCNCNC